MFQAENLGANGAPGFAYGRDADTFAYLTQPIETGGKRTRRVDAATAATKRAGLERELLARQIAARVKLAYWGAEGAERARSVLDETLRTFAQIVAYHEARVREGAMAEADLLRVRLESERIALAANTAQLEAERARIVAQEPLDKNWSGKLFIGLLLQGLQQLGADIGGLFDLF
jgi:cobalt-zinc-cadmium efflux system outer membrane protein